MRAELFGIERLEQHAACLAEVQRICASTPRVASLRQRLDNNATALRATRKACPSESAAGKPIVPAAQWLVDNFHRVEGLYCTNRVRDSSRVSSVVAGMYEQTHTADLQDPEPASLQ